MFAMTLIRPRFERYNRDVSSYTDDQIAEALLRTHPSPAAQWLSHEHISHASPQLTPAVGIGASAGGLRVRPNRPS
jgi:hypothetical protein